MFRRIVAALNRALQKSLIGLVVLYQRSWSRVSPGRCRFHPSCSEYAKQALLMHGVLLGLAYTVKRLLKCHPLHQGGIDPVPSRAARIDKQEVNHEHSTD